jgi:hypothetical protein
VLIVGGAVCTSATAWEATIVFLPDPTPGPEYRGHVAPTASSLLLSSCSIHALRHRHRHDRAISENINSADYTFNPVGTIDKRRTSDFVRSTRAQRTCRREDGSGYHITHITQCPAVTQRSPSGCHGTLERILRRFYLDSILWRGGSGVRAVRIPYSTTPQVPTSFTTSLCT